MRKLMWFTIGFAAGCAVCVYLLSGDWQLLALAAAIAVLGFCVTLPDRFRLPAVCCAIGLSVSIGWCMAYRLLFPLPSLPAEGETREITAEVCGLPEQKSYGIGVETKLRLDGRTVRTYLVLYDCEEELLPGDRIEGEFSLKKADEKDNGETNYYFISNGIRLKGYGKTYTVTSPEKIRLPLLPLRFAVEMNRSLARAVPKDSVGFLQSITTGDRTNLSEDARNDLSVSGASHVIAISGMHVTLLVMALFIVVGRGKRTAAFVCLPIILFFMLMTGASPSVVRAAIMQLLLLFAPVFWRENDPPTSLSAAGLVLLAINPWVIANVGFQLSFAAVAGLILVTPPIYSWMTGLGPIRKLLKAKSKYMALMLPLKLTKKIVLFIFATISATLGALLFTTPIAASVFGFVPLYGVLTNVLILPAVMLCFIGGLITALLGMLLPGPAAVLGKLAAWPVRYILFVCGRISTFRFASLPADDPYVISFLLVVYLIIGAALLMKIRRVDLPLIGVSAALALTLVLYGRTQRFQEFSIAVLDVGQGQCVCMQTKSFTAVLDCGGDGAAGAGTTCAGYLRDTGSRSIDALIITHYDNDHVNGVETLLAHMDVRTVYLPDVPFDAETGRRLAEAAEKAGAEVVYVSKDLKLEFPEGSLTVFGPVSMYDDNAASLSVLFSVDGYDMLATGDMDFYSEYDLIITHDLPRVDAYIAGHHGSKYASSPELLETILPETVLISVGRNNYGHPSPEALERFREIGAEVLRTDESGDLIIRR